MNADSPRTRSTQPSSMAHPLPPPIPLRGCLVPDHLPPQGGPLFIRSGVGKRWGEAGTRNGKRPGVIRGWRVLVQLPIDGFCGRSGDGFSREPSIALRHSVWEKRGAVKRMPTFLSAVIGIVGGILLLWLTISIPVIGAALLVTLTISVVLRKPRAVWGIRYEEERHHPDFEHYIDYPDFVEHYIKEVKDRNGMSLPDFEHYIKEVKERKGMSLYETGLVLCFITWFVLLIFGIKQLFDFLGMPIGDPLAFFIAFVVFAIIAFVETEIRKRWKDR